MLYSVVFFCVKRVGFPSRLSSFTQLSSSSKWLLPFFTAIWPAICFNYIGRKGWAGSQKSESETASAAGMATPTPALPDGFMAQFESPPPNKAGGNNKTGDEQAVRIDRSATQEGRKGRELAAAARRPVPERRTSACGSTSAQEPEGGCVPPGVFGGAFSLPTVPPPDEEALKPYKARVHAAHYTALERDHDPATSAVVDSLTTTVPDAASLTSPPEGYFIAYGHCLLAGAGTGASDEAAEAATAGVQPIAPDFGGASGRARVSKKNRVRGYGDALEVFQEGLRRFPTSVVLLYGASLAMQARV